MRDAAQRDERVAAIAGVALQDADRAEEPGRLDFGPHAFRAQARWHVARLGAPDALAQLDPQLCVVWLFNESPLPQLVAAKFNTPVTSVQALDPETGRERDAVVVRAASDITISLTLAGARGAVLFLPK